MIETKDSLEYLKTFKDYEFDINYSDPPYALGSEVIVRADGKVDYKKANDFMNKWEMPNGDYWNAWFKEAYRTLKHGGRNKEIENPYQRNKSVAINNHPTLKPIKLNERILKLFKTPNDQKIIYPFAGSGSEIIGGIKAGFNNWVGCEINSDYVEIAKARIDYWTTQDNQLTIFDLIGG